MIYIGYKTVFIKYFITVFEIIFPDIVFLERFSISEKRKQMLLIRLKPTLFVEGAKQKMFHFLTEI